MAVMDRVQECSYCMHARRALRAGNSSRSSRVIEVWFVVAANNTIRCEGVANIEASQH